MVSIHSLNRYEINRHRVLAVLMLCLTFGSAHFFLHDAAEANSDLIVQDECQVCRLNLVPFIPTAALNVFIPLQASDYALPSTTFEPRETHHFPALGARAPPLS